MSHKPVIPAASTPPYPAHPAPKSASESDEAVDEREIPATKAEPNSGGPTMLGAALGIGSAAILAAILYASRRRA